jgi:hypothetical protein
MADKRAMDANVRGLEDEIKRQKQELNDLNDLLDAWAGKYVPPGRNVMAAMEERDGADEPDRSP